MEINKIISDIKVCDGWAEKYKNLYNRDWLLLILMNGQNKAADAQKMLNDQLSIVAAGNMDYKKN